MKEKVAKKVPIAEKSKKIKKSVKEEIKETTAKNRKEFIKCQSKVK